MISRKEQFCDECFTKFVSMKQRKQMMSDDYYQNIFKIIYQDKKKSKEEAEKENSNSRILLPLSLGSSSLVALDVLVDMLREQKITHRNKTGFYVTVVTVCKKDEQEQIMAKIKLLKERLADIGEVIKFCILDIDQFYKNNCLSTIIFDSKDYETRTVNFNGNFSVSDLLFQTANRTSAEDLKNLIVHHLIKTFAAQNSFKAILWGHSMTRLADEIISLTVKGRGSEIAKGLDDTNFDEEFKNSFKNLHPLRDVLLSEIDAYCHIKKLSELCYNYEVKDTLLIEKFFEQTNKPAILIKSSTINNIARQYFDTIEGDYSNVISTVVRTGSKLANPDQTLSKQHRCVICNNILYRDPKSWARNITVNKAFPIGTSEEENNFKNWERAQEKETQKSNAVQNDMWGNGVASDVCYGCLVTLSGTRNKSITWLKRDASELIAEVKEYILTDDDDDVDISYSI